MFGIFLLILLIATFTSFKWCIWVEKTNKGKFVIRRWIIVGTDYLEIKNDGSTRWWSFKSDYTTTQFNSVEEAKEAYKTSKTNKRNKRKSKFQGFIWSENKPIDNKDDKGV